MINLFQITPAGLIFIQEFYTMWQCRIGLALGRVYTDDAMQFICLLEA